MTPEDIEIQKKEQEVRGSKKDGFWNWISEFSQFKIGINRIKSNSLIGLLHKVILKFIIRPKLKFIPKKNTHKVL